MILSEAPSIVGLMSWGIIWFVRLKPAIVSFTVVSATLPELYGRKVQILVKGKAAGIFQPEA